MVFRTVHNSRSTPLARTIKVHCGRFRIPGSSRYQRLETGSVHFSGDQQQVGPLHNRSFCKQTDSTTTQVCELEARSKGRGSGCLHSGLEPAQGICIPSICPNRAVSEASPAAVCLSVDDCDSSMGNSTMVPVVTRNDGRQSHITPVFPRIAETREQYTSSCPPSTSRMASLRLVSGVDMKVQQFHSQLKDCFWLHGELEQKKLIPLPGESGLVGVANDKSIPFQHL